MKPAVVFAACAAILLGVAYGDPGRNLLQGFQNAFGTGGGVGGGGIGGGGFPTFPIPNPFPPTPNPFPTIPTPNPPTTPNPTFPLPPIPTFPNDVPDSGAANPSPSGGGVWDSQVSGVLKTPAGTVWGQLNDNPKKIIEIAFRHFAFRVDELGSLLQVMLNSAKDMTFQPIEKSTSGRFYIFKIDSHTLQIFNIRNVFVDIKGSELFFQISGSGNAQLRIGLVTKVSPPRLDIVSQVKFFLEGFLESMEEHFKMEYGAGDCGGSINREVAGICNNPNALWGAANTALARLPVNDPAFADGSRAPSGPRNISPRLISNICGTQGTNADNPSNKLGLTDAFTFFGQFIDHDVGISPVGVFADGAQPLFSVSTELFTEQLPIKVPSNDPIFTGPNRKETLPFERTTHRRVGGAEVTPRQILNSLTSYLDLGQVYGSEAVRRKALRSFKGGKLKVSAGNFLPFNGAGAGGVGISLENAPNAQSRFYVGGDIRVCENANLAALHAIFLREHNRVADEIAQAVTGLDDETLFRYARDVVTAEYQSIIYGEWLPLLLGGNVVSPASYSYSPGVNPSVDAFFTTVSFRFGHTMVNNFVWKVGSGATTPFERVPLRQLFFEPEKITPANIDDYVRGMSLHPARSVDMKVVEDLRNFLFTEGGPSMDLLSLNIQRGRDVGLPSYNKARAAFRLPEATSMAGITSNPQWQAQLDLAYNGNVDLVDPFIGGLAEDAPPTRNFGPLFQKSLTETFRKLMNGDRFFYTKFPFPLALRRGFGQRINAIQNNQIKLADIIARNTGISKADLLKGRRSVFQL